MRAAVAFFCVLVAVRATAGPYAPAAGMPGSTAIAHDDPGLIAWGSSVGQVVRGPFDISDPESPLVTFGNPNPGVIGPADSFVPATGEPLTDPNKAVSLGDGGSITVLFTNPIFNGTSWDFAVFENAFNDTFLELAFVEVFDGDTWARFPTNSLTQTLVQIDQASATTNGIDPTNIDGFAGKYRASFGTPFDLSLLIGTPGLDDPWPTPFFTGGFDLDAVGAFHVVPEPGAGLLLIIACLGLALRRRRKQLSGYQVFRLSGSQADAACLEPDNLIT
jgi:hypothetical protein